MFRLTLLLCAGLFVGLLVGGEDRGQKRFGLAGVYETETRPVAVVEEAVVEVALDAGLSPVSPALPEPEPAVFTPAQPVMTAPAAAVFEVATAEAVVPAPAELPSDEAPVVWYVDSRSVNVRGGPSTADGIVGRLTRGEAVLVLMSMPGPDGWTQVRIEGDGVEGYIATRLLTPDAP